MRYLIPALFLAFSLCLFGCSNPAEEPLEETAAPTENSTQEETDSNAAETDGASERRAPQNTAASKPSTTEPASSSSSPNSSAGTDAVTKSEPAHTPSWTAKVVHHDAVYEQQWVDNWVWVERYKCGTCGAYTYSPSEAKAHQKASGREGCGAYASASYQENQGYYERVCIQEAYDETVGSTCPCGATK